MDPASTNVDDPYATLLRELRGPVASIQSYVRTLIARDGELSHTARTTMHHVVLQHTKRLDNVLDDVVLYIRLQSGAVPVHKERLLVAAIVDDVRSSLGEPDRVAVEVPGDLIVNTDREALTAVLRRLVRNALVYGPRHGTVTVRAETRDAVELHVLDTGIGIPEEAIETAIAPFGRKVAPGERRTDGAGLGLSVASELMQLLGGSLALRGNNPGLAAIIRLPS